MFRYLKEAFWARPDLGGLGRIPWNHESQADEFLFDSNRDVLPKLASMDLRLRIAQCNITTRGTEANEKAMQAPIEQLRKDCAGDIPEIESDLTRIEAQLDLALSTTSGPALEN